MSLREQWANARAQRQQEVLQRQKEVAEFLKNTRDHRLAMAADQRESLSNFHSLLQSKVATFLEETRTHQQEVWLDQARERAAYVAALQYYVWGATRGGFEHIQTGAYTSGGFKPGGPIHFQPSFTFEGTGDYIEIPNAPNPTDAMTISYWAKSDTPTWNKSYCLVSKRNAFILGGHDGTKEMHFLITQI